MPTIRQRKLVNALVDNALTDKPETLTKILENVGYKPSVAKTPDTIIEGKGVQELLKQYLPDELITEKVNWLLHHDEWQAVNAGVDKAAKLKGMYAPEKTESKSLNVNVNVDPKTQQIADEYEDKLKQNLLNNVT